MQLEVLTPEQKIFEGEASAVKLPGKDGSFQVLDDHAAMISSLRDGQVSIDLTKPYKNYGDLNEKLTKDSSSDNRLLLDISGGVVEINSGKVILLAS